MPVSIEPIRQSFIAPREPLIRPQQSTRMLNGYVAIIYDVSQSESVPLEHLQQHCISSGINCALISEPHELDMRPDLIMLSLSHYSQNRDQVANFFRNPFSGKAEKVPMVLLHHGEFMSPSQLIDAFEDGAKDVFKLPIQGIEFTMRVKRILREQAAQKDKKDEQQAVIKSLHMIIQKMTVRIDNVQKKLKQAQKRPGISDLLPEIGKLVFDLQHATPNDRSWKMHKRRTTLFDPGFIRELNWRHPELSPGELKYCCLVKLKVSRKEAADLLDVTTAAIEKRRYRIKKKIGVIGRMSLEKYMEAF